MGGILADSVQAYRFKPVTRGIMEAWLVRPEIKAEYFITPKITVRVSGDYVYSKPHIAVTTPNQRFVGEWPGNNLHANFGIAFYPFRQP
jgi:hypothetical protein